MASESKKNIAKFIDLIDAIQSVRDVTKQYLRNKLKQRNMDLTFEMLEVLIVLWRYDKLNQQEIADKVRKNKASLTSLIDNLTARKLVVRQTDTRDRRNNIIILTEEGKAYQETLQPIMDEFYERFHTHLSFRQIEQTEQMLRRLEKSISGSKE